MKKTLFVVFVCLFLGGVNASAQNLTDTEIKQINTRLDRLEADLNRNKITRSEISVNLKTVNNLQDEINQAKNIQTEKLQTLQKKISALGSAPEGNAKEPTEIANQRKTFVADEEKLKSKIAQLDLINAKISEINNLMLKIRNRSLLETIFTRQTSVFQFKEFGVAFWRFPAYIATLLKSPYVWYGSLDLQDKQTLRENLLPTILICLIAIVLAAYLSYVIRKRFGYKECTENPTFNQKLISATAMAFSYGLIPAATLGIFMLWLKDNAMVNNGNPGHLLYLAALYLLYFFLIRAAIKVIFVPNCEPWRVAKLSAIKAKAVSRTVIFAAAVILTAVCLQHFAADTGASEDVLYALRLMAITAKAAGIALISRQLILTTSEKAHEENETDNQELSISSKFGLAVTALAVAAFLASLFGYVRFGDYLLNCFLLSVSAAGIFWLADKLIRLVIHQILALNVWRRVFKINLRILAKLEFWVGILLSPVLWAGFIIAVLGIWGFSVDIMLHNIKNFLLGFNIGGMRISIISLLLGVASFFISMFLFKSLKRSLISGNLSKIEMEENSRSSLAAGISLIGFIVSFIIAITVMGGSLSSIALIAGALSFGVGLGMQNIVSNFVSGIIIIFERPIKIGDWVVINGQEGIVKTISMRATLIEAFNKSDVIIPNSTILSGILVNMTYANRTGRVELKINVLYENNIRLVEQTLLEIAANVPGILSTPAPSVAIVDFADKSLIYQLNCFTANIYNRQNIINQLREQILKTFPQKNLSIPSLPNLATE